MESPKRILIIDDSFINNLLFTDILKNAGFTVQALTSGKNAIEKIKAYLPHVVLLDVMMPQVNGLQVLEQMKGDTDVKEIPVIMITADSKPSSISMANQLGAVDYILKPIGAFDLIKTVKSNLQIEEDDN